MACRASGGSLRMIRCASAALSCVAFALVDATEPGLVVQMTQPFAINGTLYPPSIITVRQVNDYTPSTSLDEVWVGNECIGILMARLDETETSPNRNTAVFRRDENGSLELRGYTLASSGSGQTFVLTPTGRRPGSRGFRAKTSAALEAAR